MVDSDPAQERLRKAEKEIGRNLPRHISGLEGEDVGTVERHEAGGPKAEDKDDGKKVK